MPRRLALMALAVITAVACDGGGSDDTRPLPASTTVDSTTSTPSTVPQRPSARVVAARIAKIERAIRSDATAPRELPALGREQQAIYRELGADRRRYRAVLDALPGELALIVAPNVGAGSSASSLVEPPRTLPRSWRIVAPPLPAELLRYYREAESASGIPWRYLAAINFIETRMGRIVGDSSAGAQGPMQFIPSSWAAFGAGGDVHNYRDAVLAAGRYLAAAGGPGDMARAIFAYNHSNGYVDAVTRYASVMEAHERAYLGYYHWQVTYRTVDGLYLLPEGYPTKRAVRIR